MVNESGDNICSFGAEVLSKHVSSMKQEAAGVMEASDIEYIHRMRVASRRFRSALPMFADCFPEKLAETWSRDIRGVTRSLGATRDTDVQIDHIQTFLANITEAKYRPGLKRMILRLTQQRTRMQADVIRTISHIQKAEILQEILDTLDPYRLDTQNYDRSLYLLARDFIMSRLEELFIHEQAIMDEANIEELHATRIATKYLRYTMETFGTIYTNGLKDVIQECRDIQDSLGVIHDCDVWAELIPQFIIQERKRVEKFYGSPMPMLPLLPGIHHYEQAREQQRKEIYQRFLKQWTGLKQKGVWAKLVETVQSELVP